MNQDNQNKTEANEADFNWWKYALAWVSFLASAAAVVVAALEKSPPDKNEFYKK